MNELNQFRCAPYELNNLQITITSNQFCNTLGTNIFTEVQEAFIYVIKNFN